MYSNHEIIKCNFRLSEKLQEFFVFLDTLHLDSHNANIYYSLFFF